MATVNVSVTESITISPDDLVGGTPVTYSIDNPLGYSSYVALETTRNADGFYDSTSPQNISGSFSLGNGIIDIVNDNYKVGVIVASGGGELVFTPANSVVSSSLLLRGTGWSGVEYPSCPPENGIGAYINFADENTGEPSTTRFLVRLDHTGSNEIAYNFPFIQPISAEFDIYWNSNLNKWELVFSIEGETPSWTSTPLISSNWEAQQPIENSFLIVESTTCGYPELDRWCLQATGDFGSGEQTISANATPVWNEIDITEEPNAWYFYIGFYIWVEEINQWVISVFGETFPVGGTRDILPPAVVDTVAVGEITFTPSLGACS
jgi:hypothetical protein